MCTLATYDRGTALSSRNKILVSAQVIIIIIIIIIKTLSSSMS